MSIIQAKILIEKLLAASIPQNLFNSELGAIYPKIVNMTDVNGCVSLHVFKDADAGPMIVQQAFEHSTDFISITIGTSSNIFNAKLDGELFDELIDIAIKAEARADNADLKIERLRAPTVEDCFWAQGTTVSQNVVGLGLSFGGSAILGFGVGAAIGTAAEALAVAFGLGPVGFALLVIAGFVGLFYFSVFDTIGKATIKFADFVLSVLWPAKDQLPTSTRVKAAAGRVWTAVKVKAAGVVDNLKSKVRITVSSIKRLFGTTPAPSAA